eukprot:scaffold2299_cov131-Cylindrotheca_fusiformis.AAC.46
MESVEGSASTADTSSGDESTKNRISEDRYAALRNHQIRFEDAIDPNAERIYEINKMDVVFGRGRLLQMHPGNIRMREIVEKYKTRYHLMNRKGKRKLAIAVHKKISKGGIRFLKRLDGEEVWVLVDYPIALQKVTHTLRCRKSVLKQMAKEDAMTSAAESQNNPLADNKIDAAASAEGSPRDVVAGASSIAGLGFTNTMSQPPSSVSNVPTVKLETQRNVALERYRSLAGLPSVFLPPEMKYYEMARREQLIRETAQLQRMGDSLLAKSSINRSLSSKPLAVTPTKEQNSKIDESSDPLARREQRIRERALLHQMGDSLLMSSSNKRPLSSKPTTAQNSKSDETSDPLARREQLIRETALLHQMGDSLLMNLSNNRSLFSKPLTVPPTTAQKSKTDETFDPLARREQLIRETVLLQQMGDSLLMNSSINSSLPSEPLALPPTTAQNSKTDETSDPFARREQLIRETALLQRMGDSLLTNSSINCPLPSKPLAVSPTSTAQNSKTDETSDPVTG